MKNISKLLIVLVLSAFCQYSFSQLTTSFKYFVGKTAVDSSWKNRKFDDSSWSIGKSSIGYGDNDDSTIIDTTTTVYIRYKLKLNPDSISHIRALVTTINFDDGFIAYLNGKEILRINMDLNIPDPGYHQTTNRSHEALNRDKSTTFNNMYQGYFIDSLKISNCNLDSVNILAFEVHNDSTKGSDLTFEMQCNILNALYSDMYSKDYYNYYAIVNLDSTNLPIVIIETDEYGVTDDSKKATMGIISSGKYNKPSAKFNNYNGVIAFKRRGDSTKGAPKNSYKVEIKDSTGNSNNVSLLGLPKDNDWILYGPYRDRTLIKNEFTFSLGRKMGYYEPRVRFCELILNGENLGLYAITEQIKRDKNRVNITKLEKEDDYGQSLTGGYILCNDFSNLKIMYPKEDEITPEQYTYIKDFYSHFQNITNSDTFLSPSDGYKKYIDEVSLADYIIINEFSKNFDAYSKSCYMYKDNDKVDGRLKFGPLWDYDVAWYYNSWHKTTDWQFDWGNSQLRYLTRIMQDTAFTSLLKNRWFTYRKGILSDDSLFNLIDSLSNALAPSIKRNYEIWQNLRFNDFGNCVWLTHKNEIDNTKNWIHERGKWIDENIGLIEYPLSIYNTAILSTNKGSGVTIYPNPFREKLKVYLNLECSGQISIELSDFIGRTYFSLPQGYKNAGTNDFELNVPGKLVQGIYMMKVYNNRKLITNQRVVKIE